jgi:hypothetical protein
MVLSWWRSLVNKFSKAGASRGRRGRRSLPTYRRRLWAEPLEDRTLLATSAFYSMPTNLTGNQGTAVNVPLTIDHLFDANGNQGLSGADAVLTYDPTVFTVSTTDISQGALLQNPPPGGAWTFSTSVNQAQGELHISTSSPDAAHFITSQTGGVLANIQFHINGLAAQGNSTIHIVVPPESGVSGTSSANPATGPDAPLGNYVLNTADQVDGVVNVQSFNPVAKLSIATNIPGSVGGTVTVPINIDNPDPSGSTGLSSADAAILFDPNVLSVATTGAVTIGSVVPTTGWNVTYGVDNAAGALGVHLIPPLNGLITTTSPGSLWLVTFMIKPTAASGTTPLNLVPSAVVNGPTVTTMLQGGNKPYDLQPPPTQAPDDQIDGSINVINNAATHFTVVPNPSTVTAGGTTTITVTALDATGMTATTYTGMVHFTSTDTQAVLPADSTLTNGVGTFQVTLKTAGPQTITATDTVNATIRGTSSAVTVNAAAATHFVVNGPATATAGTAVNVSVTAEDQFGNTDTGFAGTVHFTSSDTNAVLPADTTLTNGTGSFPVTLKTSGDQTVTATETGTGGITGTSNTIAVSPAATSKFGVTIPGAATAGTQFSFTVTAEDQFGNTTPTYAGTVHFTSSDTQAVLPANSTLTNGTGTFQATFKTSGSQTITATDTVDNAITGTSNAAEVAPTAATHFMVNGPTNATAGTAVNVTVTALDQFGNMATGYTGTVHFTSTDTNATLPADSTLTNGTGTFQVTYKTVGNQTVTATDTVDNTIHGTSNATAVAPAATSKFAIVAPGTTPAGTAVTFTVTAEDQFGNTTPAYAGTVHFTSSDTQAVLPADSTLTNGTGSFMATLKTAGNQTITGTDTVTSSITGVSNTVAVTALAATHLGVTAPTTATAGTAFSFTVSAQDQFGNTDTSFTGTIHFTSSDSNAVLPTDSPLTNGTGTFSATLKTAGNQTITATQTGTGGLTGTSNAIAVAAAAATHFMVTAPTTTTAGTPITVGLTALDQFGNTDTAYAGTVHFTSSDSQATLPANATLTNGTGSFQVTLKTAGNQTVTATDTVTATITGTSPAVMVSAAATSKFGFTTPSTATAGTAFNFTVTAQDAFGNTTTGYTGTVHFTSSDTNNPTLPANSTLTNGVGNFQATLRTGGNQTITATDTATSTITGTSSAIAVHAAAATHFSVTAPATATAGTAVSVTVTALDPFGNTDTGYAGTVHFTSTDTQATLPANSTLTNGTGTFQVTFKTVGTQTVTATDTATSTITGTSGNVAVAAAAATHFTVTIPTTATSGTAVSATVTALDQFNNTATGYTGTVHFTSTDASASLPANSTLTNGTGSFQVTFKTIGSQTLTATDTVTSTITGTSNAATVAAGAATHFTVTAPASATNGNAFSFTVTALDANGNTATGYTGTVQFTSTDLQATLPASSTLSNGTGSFTATLRTAGGQTITATDSTTRSITGTSNVITVSSTAATVTHFAVSGPASATPGTAFIFTVTALDANNNTVTGYTGTVHFSSSDSAAVLPANSTLTNGVGTFSATLNTSGTQTITATDTANAALTGTSGAIVVATKLTGNAGFVQQAYLDLLGRLPEPFGLQTFTAALDSGKATRFQVAQAIEASPEYKTDVIEALYQKLLHRAADPSGLNSFLNFLNNGGTAAQVEIAILSSPEFFQSQGGGTNTGYLNAMYQDVLNRPIDPGAAQAFGAYLASGGSRDFLSAFVVNSQESVTDLVNSHYQAYLNRNIDPSGAGTWIPFELQGNPDELVIAAIIGSIEFFNNTQH